MTEPLPPERSRTAIILILHGSPIPEANRSAFDLAAEIGRTGGYGHVEVAFMEINEPSVSDAVRRCAELSMRRVIVVPCFLHTGRHLVLDVPGQLLEAAAAYPGLEMLMCDPVGMSPCLTEALEQRAMETLEL